MLSWTVARRARCTLPATCGKDPVSSSSSGRPAYRGNRSDTVARTLRLITGGLLAVFGKSKTPRQLHTSTVTAGIRGTGIYMEAEASRTYFCTCYGAVEFSVAGSDEKKLVMASHHKGGWINKTASNGSHFGDPVMVGHNDDDLIGLESLVGRKPPFLLPAQG